MRAPTPARWSHDAIGRAAARGADIVLADTAGRRANSTNLLDELSKVRRVADREPGQVVETLMVLDATTGQNALVQAREFLAAASVTGLVLTKLDGTARGGVVVAIERELGIRSSSSGWARASRTSSTSTRRPSWTLSWTPDGSLRTMFDALSERLERVGAGLRSRGRLSDADLDAALGEVRSALLEADVELSVVRAFIDAVRERLAGVALSTSLSPGQQVIKAVHDQLVEVLGGESLRVTYASRPPTVILLAGLQGAGKTTAAAKLALWFKQQGRHPFLVAADLQRPAAVEQLRVLGAQIGVEVFSEASDPVEVTRRGVAEATRVGRDVVILDTAGRLSIDDALMDEVRAISDATTPHYTFLVIDAVTGQDAVTTARRFHDTLGLSGIIATKLDYDARGGAVLSARGVVGRPVVFASTGERLADFDLFHPDRMASRILGWATPSR